MAQYTKKQKEDIGLSPYALIFRGQKRMEQTQFYAFEFNKEVYTEKSILSVEELSVQNDKRMIRWINIDGLDDVEIMKNIAQQFDIDNDVMSDVMNTSVRPTVREYSGGLYITLKMIVPHSKSKELTIENLSLLITNGTLLSFQEQNGDVFEAIRERIRKHKSKIRTGGAGYLAFALLDIVVDNYIYVVGTLGDKIENLESIMVKRPTKELPVVINQYKQELNIFRRYIKPAKEMILDLSKMESEYIGENNKTNYKELHANISEASELTDSYREMLNDILNTYHTAATSRLNDIMKVLTIISVFFIPLTFIVGVYGTNFDYIPELRWKYGYYAMWLAMAAIAMSMVWYFKKKRWF